MDVTDERIGIAEALNKSCHCIAVDATKLRGALESSPLTMGLYDVIRRERPHLFSSTPVFLARAQLEHMARIIAAIERVIRSDAFGQWTRGLAPPKTRWISVNTPRGTTR